MTGTITLGSSLPDIISGETLTIQGPATSPGITIDGATKYEVMLVDSGATLNVANLTIADGFGEEGGGGIDNNGTLTVTNSTFSANAPPRAALAAASTTTGR